MRYWYFVGFILTFPAGVRKSPFGFHPLLIRPLQVQPPCHVFTCAFYAPDVGMFVSVIMFVFAFPAGVRKNPCGLHFGAR